MIRAVLWDFGGVILTSPFEAFAAYELEVGLPPGFIRSVNAAEPDANAWARLERAELSPDEFVTAFEEECRRLGGELSGQRVLDLLSGAVRPEMVDALRTVRAAGLRTACLTNNVAGLGDGGPTTRPEVAEVMALFDVVVESSKVGIRKPERRFYELACEQLEVQPHECVYLDDLGVNLKPARAMGMITIKVAKPRQAIDELAAVLGVALS